MAIGWLVLIVMLNSVFRNGDESYRGVRLMLFQRMRNSLEQVLEIITKKVQLATPGLRLCSLDGEIIHDVSEIKDGENYVALEGSKGFKKVNYPGTKVTRSEI